MEGQGVKRVAIKYWQCTAKTHAVQENNKISGKQQNLIFIIESKGLALFKSYKKQNTHSHLTIISIQEI